MESQQKRGWRTSPPRDHPQGLPPPVVTLFFCHCPTTPNPFYSLHFKPSLPSQPVLRGSCEPVFPAPWCPPQRQALDRLADGLRARGTSAIMTTG